MSPQQLPSLSSPLARDYPICAPAYPKAVFLVLPEQFALAQQSAADNRYMQMQSSVDSQRAHQQALNLLSALRAAGQAALAFPGRRDQPDGVFPNNVFATRPGVFVRGRMRHAVRQHETERADLQHFFRAVLNYREHTLPERCTAELTGSLVLDRARRVGFAGLTERCDAQGADAMHQAFELKASWQFALAASEYHTNVVMSTLGGKSVVLAPSGFADPKIPDAIARFYGSAVLLGEREKAEFAGNCIALAPSVGDTTAQLWMSERAADALTAGHHAQLQQLGFRVYSVALDEIEKAGGSLRCMLGEIY
jgi:hypothetical protein